MMYLNLARKFTVRSIKQQCSAVRTAKYSTFLIKLVFALLGSRWTGLQVCITVWVTVAGAIGVFCIRLHLYLLSTSCFTLHFQLNLLLNCSTVFKTTSTDTDIWLLFLFLFFISNYILFFHMFLWQDKQCICNRTQYLVLYESFLCFICSCLLPFTRVSLFETLSSFHPKYFWLMPFCLCVWVCVCVRGWNFHIFLDMCKYLHQHGPLKMVETCYTPTLFTFWKCHLYDFHSRHQVYFEFWKQAMFLKADH